MVCAVFGDLLLAPCPVAYEARKAEIHREGPGMRIQDRLRSGGIGFATRIRPPAPVLAVGKQSNIQQKEQGLREAPVLLLSTGGITQNGESRVTRLSCSCGSTARPAP